MYYIWVWRGTHLITHQISQVLYLQSSSQRIPPVHFLNKSQHIAILIEISSDPEAEILTQPINHSIQELHTLNVLLHMEDKITHLSSLHLLKTLYAPWRRSHMNHPTARFSRVNEPGALKAGESDVPKYHLLFLSKGFLSRGVHVTYSNAVLKCLPCRTKSCTTTEEAQGKQRRRNVNKINPHDFEKYYFVLPFSYL